MKKIFNLLIGFVCASLLSGCIFTPCEQVESEEWCMNSTHHWHECKECEEKMHLEEHDWEEVVVIEGNEIQGGLKYLECKDCGVVLFLENTTTTITEEGWNTAINLNNYDGVKVFASLTDGEETETGTFTKTGNMIHISESSTGDQDYYTIEDGQYYHYYNREYGDWKKVEITRENYYNGLDFSRGLTAYNLDYSDFEYDEDLRCYYAETETSYVATFKLYFANGKLMKLEFTDMQQGVDTSYTVEYGDYELELPVVE